MIITHRQRYGKLQDRNYFRHYVHNSTACANLYNLITFTVRIIIYNIVCFTYVLQCILPSLVSDNKLHTPNQNVSITRPHARLPPGLFECRDKYKEDE
jgi:hypothetical protein